ncbi:MAG: hypothetical protein WA405_04385 [Candidatus Acidiferrales bacterium]
MSASEVQMQHTKHTAAAFAENLTIGAGCLCESRLNEARSATAIPDAVIIVFTTSTYIVRLSMFVYRHPAGLSSVVEVDWRQILDTK